MDVYRAQTKAEDCALKQEKKKKPQLPSTSLASLLHIEGAYKIFIAG